MDNFQQLVDGRMGDHAALVQTAVITLTIVAGSHQLVVLPQFCAVPRSGCEKGKARLVNVPQMESVRQLAKMERSEKIQMP